MDQEQRERDMMSGFSEITGASLDNSRFFLESANWNLELALTSFYETFGSAEGVPSMPQFSSERNQGEESASRQAIIIDSDEDEEEEIPVRRLVERSAAVVSSPASTTNPSNATRSRFATISSLRAQESSSDDDDAQAYYAGGSQHSGQQVVGPPKPSHEIISDMFRSLRDQGGVEAISHEPGGTSIFSGLGYRLGQSSDDTQIVNAQTGRNVGEEQQRDVVLRLWRDGFSIDDGPLRSYNDPHEREFLARIRQGNVPTELFPNVQGGTIHLSLEDHRNENFVALISKPTPFTGKGHVLGSSTTDFVMTESEDPPKTGESQDTPPDQPVASSVTVDNTKPVTTIQIRLPNGGRVQIMLNQTHTVADLRAVIMEQRPEFHAGNFTLMTTFPRRELTDENITISAADILNSALLLLKK